MFKERLKGFITGAIVTTLIIGCMAVFAEPIEKVITATYNDIKIYIDGAKIEPKDVDGNKVEPFVYNGTTYLPVRAIGQAFDKTVDWDGTTQSIYIGQKPGSVQYMFDIVPAYQSDAYEEYSSIKSGGDKSFMMSGVKYINGCVWSPYSGMSGDISFSLYNLNGQYDEISGMLGHIDNEKMSGGILKIFADGKLIKEIELFGDMIPQELRINTKGILQLKFEVSSTVYSSACYGFANVEIK